MLILIISAAVTAFLLFSAVLLALTSKPTVEARLEEVSRTQSTADTGAGSGLDGVLSLLPGLVKPIRSLLTANDEELSLRLGLAGYRDPVYVDVYAAAKLLLPVFALVGASFAGSNMLAVALIGGAAGFFAPDIWVTQVISRRRDSIRRSLPDALDLLVICMEAGLGVDQALIRVAHEIRLTSPALADEFQIINREQRAGKPRTEAWRSMSDRVDIDFVRQFVAMLVQTERFGTPIAHALGQFADGLRIKRTQIAEELAAKAGVKLLFPLVIFIFPSIFVVLLGPPLLNIIKSLSEFAK